MLWQDYMVKKRTKIFHENIDVSGKKVLEIGCGVGRWVEALHDKCGSYLGLDFSEELLEIAKKTYNYENCKFQLMSATDIKVDELLIEPPFDVKIFSGFLMYINDDDLDIIMDEVNQIGAENKKIFAMEPTSCMETRLTLKDFYSEGLESDYSAIYRTEGEYLFSSMVISLLSYIYKKPMRVSIEKIIQWDNENYFASDEMLSFFNKQYLTKFVESVYETDCGVCKVKQSRTSAASLQMPRIARRLNFWSRKKPVFCPSFTSTIYLMPFSVIGTFVSNSSERKPFVRSSPSFSRTFASLRS